MKRFVEGDGPKQVMLLPECLDDLVAEDNHVRIIDAFVEGAELGSLVFEVVRPSKTGAVSAIGAA